MRQNMKRSKLFLVAIATIVNFMPLASANAQQSLDQPWSFSSRNGASIAALIKSVRDGSSNNDAAAFGTGNTTITSLVCGSNGSSSATGNSSCIILNNSDGAINTNQDSDGNQTASSEENLQVENVEELNVSDISDVEDILDGPTNGSEE